MKSNKLFCIVLILFFVLTLQGCKSAGISGILEPKKIDGIDKPVTINGIDYLVSKVARTDTYGAGSQATKPKFSGDILLIVQADVSANNDEVKKHNWKISVVDENGRESVPGQTSFMSGIIEGESKNIMTLIFAVDKNSNSFSLLLPENTIVLDSLLSK
jgi:hypothetical protein